MHMMDQDQVPSSCRIDVVELPFVGQLKNETKCSKNSRTMEDLHRKISQVIRRVAALWGCDSSNKTGC